MCYDTFNLSLIERVPVPKEMIDAIWWQMKNDPQYKHTNEHLEVLTDELRTQIACRAAEKLRGLVYTCGASFYQNAEAQQAVIAGKSFAFTVNKQFAPEIESALLFRLWHVGAPKDLLGGAYEWYVSAIKHAGEYFCEKEWELALSEAGEVIARLTGCVRPKSEPAERGWKRASAVQFGDLNPK